MDAEDFSRDFGGGRPWEPDAMGFVSPLQLLRYLVVALTFCGDSQAFALAPTAVPNWGGEYLRPDQGLASLEMRVDGIAAKDELATRDEPVQIYIKNVNTQGLYVIDQPIAVEGKKSRSLYWKLPVGRYQIMSITRARGTTTQVATKLRVSYFVIKGFSLSDLGVWIARPGKKRQLNVKFYSRVVESFTFPEGDDTLSAIIDGFSGKTLKKLDGGANSERARVNFGTQDEMRATITETRVVSMVYKIDLKRDSRYNKAVFPIVKGREARLRQCYLDGLRLNDALKGTVKFNLTLAKGRGTVQSLKYKGGTLMDQRTVECLYAELGQMQFPVRAPLTAYFTFGFGAD